MRQTSDSAQGPGHALARKLLDGASAVDSAATQAIDGALRRGSNDPVVHAAALWMAFSTGADLGLSRSRARSWLPGLHELIHSGHLDAVAHALPIFEVEFPRSPYLDSMAYLFRHVPPPVDNGREPFLDDRASDVQVVRFPGADTVVITFCGGHHTLGIPMNLMDRWLAPLRAHLVYLRDREKIAYLGGVPALGHTMEATIESLNRLVSDLGGPRVVCLGNSAGATGAVRYASALRARRLLALSPITGGTEYAAKADKHLPRGGVRWWGDLVPIYRDGGGVRTHVVYGEQNDGDRQQASRLAGLPGVTIEALPGWEAHHLIHGLVRAKRIGPVLDWLVSDDCVDAFADAWEPTNSAKQAADRAG